MKREQASSQSDEESDSRRERRKRKKSRWGNDPPVDMKPPGMVAPFPTGVPGIHNITVYTITVIYLLKYFIPTQTTTK